MGSLSGKTTIITGAARGIGYAIAEKFLKEGALVMVSDHDEDALADAERQLSELGKVKSFVCDVSERLDVHNLLARTIDELGQIDVLVNNAAISHEGDFLEIKEADFERVLNVNLKGAFLTGQAIAKHMVKRVENGEPAGNIINISSVNDTLVLPSHAAYTVSKGGLKQLTRLMAVSLAPKNIRVNAIGPGSIATDMLSSMLGESDRQQRILERTPMGRVGEPSEIASIAAFLASDQASYITGQTLYGDGGRLPLGYSMAPIDD